jgi:hypothetical protein
LDVPAREEYITSDVQGVGAIAHESGEGRLDLAPAAGLEDLNLQSYCTGGVRYVSQRALGSRDIGRIVGSGEQGRRHDAPTALGQPFAKLC